jgi:hypothetical protein
VLYHPHDTKQRVVAGPEADFEAVDVSLTPCNVTAHWQGLCKPRRMAARLEAVAIRHVEET